jgi:hypothetical protein
MGDRIMSTVLEGIEAQEIAGGLMPLLKEYTKKLTDKTKEVEEFQRRFNEVKATKAQTDVVRAQRDFDSLRFGLFRLFTPANDLVREASQIVEHGKVEPVTRLELSLRLAEFEAILHQLQQKGNAGPEG